MSDYENMQRCRGCGEHLWQIGESNGGHTAWQLAHNEANCLASKLDRCLKVMRAVKEDLLDRARVDGDEHVVDLSNRCWRWLCAEVDGTSLPGSVQNYWAPDHYDGNVTLCGRCHQTAWLGHVCPEAK